MITVGFDPSIRRPGVAILQDDALVFYAPASSPHKAIQKACIFLYGGKAPDNVVIEAMFGGKGGKMSVQNAWQLGRSVGRLESLCGSIWGMHLDAICSVPPSTWRSVCGVKKQGKESFKDAARRRCKELWDADITSDDAAEAALIGLYGYKKAKARNQESKVLS